MSKFAKYAWFVVGYNILVILWGAVVRATGSGAGCGNHWPKCNGEIVPTPESIETLIEFSHRITSAAAGFLVIGLVVWAFRVYPRKSQVRIWAIISLAFILIEGWIGMLLVRYDLVAYNVSKIRAFVVALHLINTFLLLASMAITAWLASHNKKVKFRRDRTLGVLFVLCVVFTLAFSAAGAVTALGDTLFPAESLAEGLKQDLDPAGNFLIQLRVIHPALAILVSFFIYRVVDSVNKRGWGDEVNKWGRIVIWTMVCQIIGGFINVLLLAPVWMQVIHLLLADLFWLALIIFFSNVMFLKVE